MSAERQFIDRVPAVEIKDGHEIMLRDTRVKVWEVGIAVGEKIVFDTSLGHVTYAPSDMVWRFVTPSREPMPETRTFQLDAIDAQAMSAAAVDGGIEVLAVANPPILYRIGEIGGGTLHHLLGAALEELKGLTNQQEADK